MVSLKFAALALTFLRAFAVDIQIPVEGDPLSEETSSKSPNLAVEVSTTFPQSELFGVKLVNGNPTRAVFDIANNDPQPVTIHMVTGTLWTPRDAPGAPSPPVPVRNLTAQRYGLEIPPGEKETLTYSFTTELHPQDLNLVMFMILQGGSLADSGGQIFTKMVYNETVSVVEAAVSVFDPQIIFLYLVLAAVFGGTCYFIYSTWITTLFPQKRRGGKGGERAKKSSGGTKKVDPADQVAVVGADGAATTTGAKAYDESWIPVEHLKRPEPKRVGSGRPKSRAA